MLETDLYILLGGIAGILMFILLYTDYFHDRYNRNIKWKIAFWVIFAITFLFIALIYIISILAAGSIMTSAKEKYWDKVK